MSKSIAIKEISNPQEFKEFYLNDAHHSFCEECDTIEYIYGSGFLEVIALEELKKIQKKTFGDRTRRKFYSIVLLTEGETEETIGHKNIVLDQDLCISFLKTSFMLPKNGMKM